MSKQKLFRFLLLNFLLVTLFSTSTFAQKRNYFPPEDLTSVGAYYYPEHWDESQWERDIKKNGRDGF